MEKTLEMAALHQKASSSISLRKVHRTSELGRCTLSINLLEFVFKYALKGWKYHRISILKNFIYSVIGIHIQTEFTTLVPSVENTLLSVESPTVASGLNNVPDRIAFGPITIVSILSIFGLTMLPCIIQK